MSHDLTLASTPRRPPAALDAVGVLGASIQVVRLAGRAHAYSPELARHGHHVADLATRMGRHLGLTGRDLLALRWAALLHDVGKITWPLDLWEKPGGLTPDERRFVNLHAQASERLACEHGLAVLAPALRHHHERWDGAGYPDGVSGANIPLAARIIAVADVYDVLRRGRPYREALDTWATLAELRRFAGTQFDPGCVEALGELLTRDAARPVVVTLPSLAVS